MPGALYFQDLHEGQTFRSQNCPIDAEHIKNFARQYDPQPFHTDEAQARQMFFGELVASGWHTAAVTMRLMVQSIGISGGLVGASVDELRWPRPLRPGDVLRVESQVLSVRGSKSKPSLGLVRIRHTTLNQQDEPVQTFVSTIIVPKREYPKATKHPRCR